MLAWRRGLKSQAPADATIRHKLAASSPLFEHLCETNAIVGNPVKDVKCPKMVSAEGKTPAIGDHQTRALLAASNAATLRGKRDRPFTLLYHCLRRTELYVLSVGDVIRAVA